MLSPNPTPDSIDELIAFARSKAPFYRELYADLPEKPALATLPIIDQEEYWQAHGRDRQEVLTGPLHDGFVFKSGGTTGAPKFSYCTRAEWNNIIQLSTRSFEGAGLRDGDRVATLFASGNLYASQMYATESLERAQPKVLQFLIGVFMPFPDAAAIIQSFQINVLVGLPTHMMQLVNHLEREGPEVPRIERILYAGEPFSKADHAFLKTRFPGVQVRSAGYASVDAGVIAYAAIDCAPGEHRVYDGATVVEIIDEGTGLPITETGQPGRIVFTNVFRRLMPIVRYPAGDRGQWIEPPGAVDRKFLLLGRSEEAARVATFAVSVSDAARLLEPFREALGIGRFQLLVQREDRLDRLTFRVSATASSLARDEAGESILQKFLADRPDIDTATKRGIVHPSRLEWIRPEELITSERTGKTLNVVDQRNG